MGRHAAQDGDAVHPVVAEALARRPADTAGTHRGERGAGPVGWPGGSPAPGSGGLGWPGDLAPTAPVGSLPEALADDAPADEPEEPAPPADGGRRRGWRRLLGLDRAA